jgi:hypothetical protein
MCTPSAILTRPSTGLRRPSVLHLSPSPFHLWLWLYRWQLSSSFTSFGMSRMLYVHHAFDMPVSPQDDGIAATVREIGSFYRPGHLVTSHLAEAHRFTGLPAPLVVGTAAGSPRSFPFGLRLWFCSSRVQKDFPHQNPLGLIRSTKNHPLLFARGSWPSALSPLCLGHS